MYVTNLSTGTAFNALNQASSLLSTSNPAALRQLQISTYLAVIRGTSPLTWEVYSARVFMEFFGALIVTTESIVASRTRTLRRSGAQICSSHMYSGLYWTKLSLQDAVRES